MKMATKKTWEALNMKQRTDKAQTQTMTKTATSLSFSETDEEIDTAAIEEEEWIDI